MADLEFTVDDHVAVITLNRPHSMNAFSVEMIYDWIKALEEIRDNDDIHVGVLTGKGRAFCAGGDTKAMIDGKGFMAQKEGVLQYELSDSPLDVKNSLWKHIQRIPLIMQDLDKPMIAAINGAAIGAGLDMALMCDIRYASDKAKLGEGYIHAGIVPGDGGGFYLPRIIGLDKALELLWSGKVLTAQEALKIGLVTKVIPDKQLHEDVMKFAHTLSHGPQEVIKMMKRIVYESTTMSLKQSLDLVSSFMAIAVKHSDHYEALKAMKEKRDPVFNKKS